METNTPAPGNPERRGGVGSLDSTNVTPPHGSFNDLEAYRHWERIGCILHRSGERATAQFVAWLMTTPPRVHDELVEALIDFTAGREANLTATVATGDARSVAHRS